MFQSLQLSDAWHCGCSDAQLDSSNNEKALEAAIELIDEHEEGSLLT